MQGWTVVIGPFVSLWQGNIISKVLTNAVSIYTTQTSSKFDKIVLYIYMCIVTYFMVVINLAFDISFEADL